MNLRVPLIEFRRLAIFGETVSVPDVLLPFSFCLNYPNFSDSCLFFQLATSKYLSKMIAYRSNVNTKYHGGFPYDTLPCEKSRTPI